MHIIAVSLADHRVGQINGRVGLFENRRDQRIVDHKCKFFLCRACHRPELQGKGVGSRCGGGSSNKGAATA